MKPKIICHIMSSVDGRLIDSRWTAPYKAEHGELLQVYSAIGCELNTDAWMFGKNTVRGIFPYKFSVTGHVIKPDTPTLFIGERRSKRMFIIADRESDIYFTSATVRGDNILVIAGQNATEEYLAHLREKQISYVIISDAANLREGLEAVGREFGIRSISVQGGGILNGALLADKLIDELSLVIYPGIDGLSGVPSVFEYVGGTTEHPAQGLCLQLISVSEREHGVMWMRYKFHKNTHK
ncbi:dihydrofolate reductase family protein [Bacteroides faecalis]|uniref:5-amino-6-(5-phosphoribosylamino)uracil reductase n=1 Tax=Bacteroides faecalis TaxID=2447885 RepID=A0A401LQR5_9BACE|nr:dihydrofolate reductase family protein [Bacteroides faecalis]GCB33844.1 5-amino-6-(5-phosphoribosylamino)uracil reductase [Bacteroides faecalis]